MSLAWQAALGKLRVVVLIAGLAWLAGLTPPWPARAAIAVLVVAALVIDGVIDDQRITRHLVDTRPPIHHRTR